ncbi:MAG: hypothetical protein K6E71_05000, partial [Lachnospiraceae bacterium]|nr:hypothetical protein [Lachnospiraceae bacterium]
FILSGTLASFKKPLYPEIYIVKVRFCCQKLFKEFQGCFTVRFSRFIPAKSPYSYRVLSSFTITFLA